MLLRRLTLLVALAGCATAPPPSRPTAPQRPAGGAAAPAEPPPDATVATVDGAPITAAELESHMVATKLPRQEALDDLIDVVLLRAACAANGIALAPGRPTPELRAATELELARKMSLEPAPGADTLIVDHAWIKDAPRASQNAKQKKALEELRARVVAGQSIPDAFKTLPGVDAAAWHIGDHEEYPYDVVPAAAHDLPPGSVSPIVAGDGGLHLFQIHARKAPPPPAVAVHAIIRARLRDGKLIETSSP